MARTTLRQKGPVTLLAQIREALHVEDGDEIEFEITPDGAACS
jgi:bifunctional DNA-binding transcriptional regulator/antitoxin component of YhaV-PrlF toxin-antitoxin module